MLLQDLPEAAGWRQQAERELVRCCQNQFTPEGGQAEGCPHYHAVCLDVLARSVRICREAGLGAPPAVADCLQRGMDYMLQSTRPTGDIVPWGDSDVVPLGVASAVKTYTALGEASWLR